MKYSILFLFSTILLSACITDKNTEIETNPAIEIAEEHRVDQSDNIDTTTSAKIAFEELNYIFIGSNSYVEFFGASNNDKWYKPDEVIGYLEENAIEINIFGAYEEINNVPIKSDFILDEICSCISFNLANTDFSSSLIGISGNWDIYNCRIEEGSEYVDIAREHLSKLLHNEGINNPTLNISKINQLDYDNDGKDDIIFQAENDSLNNHYLTLRGSYSIIMLISDINGSAIVIPICKTIYKYDAENEMNLLVPFELLDICDLNGDNIQEFIISSGYYEGGGSDIFIRRSDKFESVLGCICGT